MRISVIVTNWNGIALLKKYLETVITTSSLADEIIVADDASTDDSVNYVKSLQYKYPKLKLIKRLKNIGFGKNSNDAVKKAIGDLVVLFNSDIMPEKDYLKQALPHFKNPQVFGVGFAEINHENYGKIFWDNGYVQIDRGFSKSSHITAWLSGGSSIFRRSLFLKLGGFDPIYQPFYFEDLDLGLRAWRSGYQLIWEPRAKVRHLHESTTSKFSRHFLTYVKERNHLICTKRNFSDKSYRLQNNMFVILRVLFGPNYLKIILAAKRQLKKYPKPLSFPKIDMTTILQKFKSE